jgi:hypothetical protein
MKRVVAGVIVVLAVVAYVAGYWPEYQQRRAVETELAAVRSERDELDGQVRVARLLGQLLNVTEAVAALNFGQAQTLSSTFFDEVRAEAARTESADVRATLEAIHQNRDTVTSALARGDADVMGTLRSMQVRLRETLGYPVAATAPVVTPPPEATPPPAPPAEPTPSPGSGARE